MSKPNDIKEIKQTPEASAIGLCPANTWYSLVYPPLRTIVSLGHSDKGAGKIGRIINNSFILTILSKCAVWVQYRFVEAGK